MKILIAEDNLVSQNAVKKILENSGYEVITAQNGQEAWNLLKGSDFQMVITDWMMPGMDGLTLCKKIREGDFSNHMYLILLTAKDKNEDLVHGFEYGFDDFLEKPVEPNELKARVLAGERIVKLEEELKKSQAQLLQSEKMASVGQLAAGVAHEINNPTGFVSSNLKTLSDYQDDISGIIKAYRKFMEDLKNVMSKDAFPSFFKDQIEQIMRLEEEADLDFIMDDIGDLIEDCREGTERIKKIVIDLKDFAHPGEDKVQITDINNGIESTLNVVWNELKYKTKVTKEYGKLPEIKCYPQQLNQVFMNILVNAAQAIEKQGKIHLSTLADDGYVEIKIRDTGSGIPEEHLSKIFDPFFTTKEVGKGTGLGLNVAYNIIKKHNGTIDVKSEVGKGTEFNIRIPVDFKTNDK
jgi:two-component system NtrC family sensor kinase